MSADNNVVPFVRIHRSREEEAKRDRLVRAAIRMATKFSEYRRLGYESMATGAKEADELIAAAVELLP